MAAPLREIFARFGVQFDDKQLKRGTRSINTAVQGLKAFGAAIAGAAIVRGVRSFVGSTIQIGDELDKTAQQLGLTANQFQGLSHSANLAGVDSVAFANSLGQVQRNALMAAEGSGEASDAFQELGIDVENTDGTLKSANDLLLEVSDGLATMDDENRRVGLSMILMGRSGRRMLPMLNQGSEAIRAQALESQRLTGDLTGFVAASVELTDSQTRLDQALLGLRARMAVEVLPIINRATRTLTEMAVTFREATAGTGFWEAALVGITAVAVATGVYLAAAFAVPLLTIGLIALALLVVFAALNDVYVAAQGGESVIGSLGDEFLDAIGAGFSFQQMLQGIWDVLVGMGDAARSIGQFFTGIFGEDPEGPDELAAQEVRTGFGAGRAVRETFSAQAAEEGETYRTRVAARRERDKAAATERKSRGPLLPLLGEGAGAVGRAGGPVSTSVTVEAAPVNLTVNQTETSDTGEIRRVVREENDRGRRQTLAALETATQTAAATT